MSNKMIGYVLIAVGIVLLLAVIFAAPLHLGGTGFGYKKIIATVVSLAVLGGGAYMSFLRKAG